MASERNPLNRSFSEEEIDAAAVVWPQYHKVRERDRGPLFWSTAKRAWIREISVRISKAEKQIKKMRIVLGAIEREWEDPRD